MTDEVMETECSFCGTTFESSESAGLEDVLCDDCEKNTFICQDCHQRAIDRYSSLDVCTRCGQIRQDEEEDEPDPASDPEADDYYGGDTADDE